MGFDIHDLNLYISEFNVIKAIINQRIQELKSEEPRFRLVFPRTILAFVWLFLILASFTMLGISVISFYFNLVLISKVYSDLIVFLLCFLLIPLIVSWRSYLKNINFYHNKLQEAKTEPIHISEIESYFSVKKTQFSGKYEEYIKNVQQKIENIKNRVHLSSTTADEVQGLRYRITQAVDRLEMLKDDYFLRLDAVESQLKHKLIDNNLNIEIAAIMESQKSVERLEEEVEAINYYLQAVDEIG